MKNYYRIMLGRGSMYVQDCLAGNFIGVDYGIEQDLTGKLPDEWRLFNRKYIPVYLEKRPEKTRVAAGLAMGTLWTITKGIQCGDMVLCPDGEGHYHVGEVSGDYLYQPGGNLPHRRPVNWLSQTVNRADMSEALRKSAGAAAPYVYLANYQDEIERLIAGICGPQVTINDATVENTLEFVMEKHLEDFIVQNWQHLELAKDYLIYEVEGERVGQQYPTDSGPIDILAISKDKQNLLVIELKRGRANDVVVGQILRYMGYVKEELLEVGQDVKGIIIAMEDDPRLRRALAMVPNIEFYRYQVNFKLKKVI